MHRCLLLCLLALSLSNQSVHAQQPNPTPMALVLPTDNDGLLRSDEPGFYMFVDRNFEKQTSTPWEGGQYGYVRGPVRLGSKVVLMAFHEGLDIAPLKRDANGTPLDQVRSISHGEVVHVSDQPGASNYGRYVVIRHDWTDGAFYSLYAHLARVDVQPGRPVLPGTPIGILGYSGVGLDKRRSHLHLELNLFLSSRFNEWHEKNFRPSPNAHGLYNGLNLAGMDLARLYLERQKNPTLSVSQFVRTQEPEWKVIVPRRNTTLELLQNYPWLGEDTARPSPSWEISLSGSGLPLHIRPVDQSVTQPQVSWVKDTGIPHVYHTRKHVSGSGGKGTLTASGIRHVELITSDFLIAAPK
ncbi:M23 family metallopeptidase [Phragmitibacter flavus]|uniref:M23 family metallopeptidase n=1 Tax=Phragmitibacter flavus TaxID=2576071 RepID=A0A5R8KFE0_9BACT|nr:M23 family metallopeptidase [Phragmitibacter flavus]TLD70319.1 M23 family metallopeptidase [Phragmitibacter flavus]